MLATLAELVDDFERLDKALLEGARKGKLLTQGLVDAKHLRGDAELRGEGDDSLVEGGVAHLHGGGVANDVADHTYVETERAELREGICRRTRYVDARILTAEPRGWADNATIGKT